VENNQICVSEASNAFHHRRSCFEGLKANRMKVEAIQLFRMDQNPKRM
jgi:branched-subunit amino acid aminotransferase/4-amino-4-deoxychorismate lyase